jgi:peptide methionine sulfoxide reductase MsrA
VVSGYTGCATVDPIYRQVCTGHRRDSLVPDGLFCG